MCWKESEEIWSSDNDYFDKKRLGHNSGGHDKMSGMLGYGWFGRVLCGLPPAQSEDVSRPMRLRCMCRFQSFAALEQHLLVVFCAAGLHVRLQEPPEGAVPKQQSFLSLNSIQQIHRHSAAKGRLHAAVQSILLWCSCYDFWCITMWKWPGSMFCKMWLQCILV